ncbi:MAG: TetR/AcrR family transcriptional regulator [Treponema sp.]|nr:TetR/AcrR family transcriptional regulator [Treponema sp.]
MSKKNISQEKIIQSFLTSAFEKSAGATSLADISEILEIKKASLYNHFENRDAMYDATIYHCGKEIEAIRFLPEKTISSIQSGKTSPSALFKKLLTRYFEMYENEPFFQIYVFIHTEQYFNVEALKIVEKEIENITEDIRQILQAFIDSEKISKHNDKETRDLSLALSSLILQQRDFYIAQRKETVRQNPDCGAGSLFALPTDEGFLNKTIKLVDTILKTL